MDVQTIQRERSLTAHLIAQLFCQGINPSNKLMRRYMLLDDAWSRYLDSLGTSEPLTDVLVAL